MTYPRNNCWHNYELKKPRKESKGMNLSPADYLFEVEFYMGNGQAVRSIYAVFYSFGDIGDWTIPFSSLTLKSALGEYRIISWCKYPKPHVNPKP